MNDTPASIEWQSIEQKNKSHNIFSQVLPLEQAKKILGKIEEFLNHSERFEPELMESYEIDLEKILKTQIKTVRKNNGWQIEIEDMPPDFFEEKFGVRVTQKKKDFPVLR